MIRNTWHFYHALVLVFKVLCGGIGIALLTYMVSPQFCKSVVRIKVQVNYHIYGLF
ncbi:conserved hypothetical protein [Vibrio nigripulchritudo SFn118]|nr:conserved hypothetical protein [Vibrio nigripulchritudo SFn118]